MGRFILDSSSTNYIVCGYAKYFHKTGRHDITGKLLKVALNTINPNPPMKLPPPQIFPQKFIKIFQSIVLTDAQGKKKPIK